MHPMSEPLFPQYLLWIWFTLTALSVAYVAWDLFTRTPEMKVMKWGWVLVTLYTGPVGLLIYWFSCREPAPGTHEQFVAPLWKQTVGSTIHCLAGDATGIIAAAIITSWLRLPMGIDIWVEYAAGFLFGLLIFQALFMKDMLGGSYSKAMRASFYPEWVSMNAVMAGMIPTMVILMTRDMTAMEPASVRFWGIMSLATLVGALTAYPINWWLVKNQLKHGMGTERALGKGGPPPERATDPAITAHTAASAAHMRVAADASAPGGQHATGHHNMGGQHISASRKAAVALLSLLLLAVGYYLAAQYGDLSMRPGMPMDAMPGMDMPGHQM
ncbi:MULTISPECIES: DUF4396 domain-containing protein [unclassified Hymenobacter]|uniref:DUF4396 domain-containing protein n=1 Tax=unclassified Hymenobacter TaxID=2615202 RepID=UPI0005C7594A|nr:DUF4396 domain-containing protein [Hymenobacter sp. APR13]